MRNSCIQNIGCSTNKSFKNKAFCFILIILLAMPFLLTAYDDTFTGPGNWSTGNWSGSPSADFLNGNITEPSNNITINGRVDVGTQGTPEDLTIGANASLTLVGFDAGDTLYIWGNFNINSGNTTNFNMGSGCIVVRGDVNISSGTSISLSGGSGAFFGVSGNFNNPNGGNNFNSNGSNVYILGSAGEPFSCSNPDNYTPPAIDNACEYGNTTALINIEDAYTRWLLLGKLPLEISCAVTTPITCNGYIDGAVTVTATFGTGSYKYQFSDDNSNWTPLSATNTYIFSPLGSGPHTFYIRDDGGGTAECTINVPEPAELELSVSGKSWSCDLPGCNGTLITEIRGGTPPYILSVNSVPSLPTIILKDTIDPLCAGDYDVRVSDQNTCPTIAPPTYSIALDVAMPVCANEPAATVFIQNTDFTLLPSVIDTIENYFINNLAGTGNRQVIGPITLNSTLYNSIQLQLLATKNGIWVPTDTIRIEVSYDGTTWSSVLQSFGSGAIPNNFNDLDNSATNILYRIVFHSGHDCSIEHLYVLGNNMARAISTNGPSNCNNEPFPNVPTPSPPSDGSINWFCADPANLEFSFQRSWTVFDGCKTTYYNQTISVGESPEFDVKPLLPLTFDICHHIVDTIAAPEVTDACGVPEPIVTWSIKASGSDDEIDAGNDSIFGFNFQQPVYNDTVYIITWTVTDGAGITATAEQNVIILRPMQILLEPYTAADENFCTGKLANFTISVSGGTEVYQNLVLGTTLLPGGTGSTWSSNSPFSVGIFETSNLTIVTPGTTDVITVNYFDANNNGVKGGCDVTRTFYNGTDYNIHQLIPTGVIGRD